MMGLEQLLADKKPATANFLTGWQLSPLAAVDFLKRDLPDVPKWMLWCCQSETDAGIIRMFIGDGATTSGQLGDWKWERVNTSMPELHFWSGEIDKRTLGLASAWVGLLRIRNVVSDRSFYLFSYFRANTDRPNSEYLVSSDDVHFLHGFLTDVGRALSKGRRRRQEAFVSVLGGMNFSLSIKHRENIYLPEGMLPQIESEVFNFFESKKLFAKLNCPWRKGILLSGSTGTGKSTIIRHLAKECYRKYRMPINYLVIRNTTDSDELNIFFHHNAHEPKRLLIIEDIDSICGESRITRSEFLGMLDGISTTNQGYLLIGSTNNPAVLDPALINRPSRFDKVWKFDLPSSSLKMQFMRDMYPSMDGSVLQEIVARSKGWSFAYMKELRISAAILALKNGQTEVTSRNLLNAFESLHKQFASVSKIKTEKEVPTETVGFSNGDEAVEKVA